MPEPHFVVLGAGPAGCGAAAQLRRGGHGRVSLVERGAVVGGNAASFRHEGIWLDYGSHRLHAACDPAILGDIRAMLGSDLGHFDRHGRIRLRGRWLHFPIQALDLLLHLDPRFGASMVLDMVRRTVLPKPAEGDSFASVLRANLGPTMCEQFYFPYARKLWGREPEELSGIQARKRVTAGSFKKLLKRLVKPPGAGKYYYPREGYGQITRAYAEAAREAGAEVLLNTSVSALERPGATGRWRVVVQTGDSGQRVLEADHVWSTIPVTQAARMMVPTPPAEVITASETIDYQGMILVYLVLDIDQWTTTDAHYFPEANVSVTRVSEPKNYFRSQQPKGRTILCAELPCTPASPLWAMTDAELGELVAADLARAEVPIPRPPMGVFARRLRQAYPIYPKGYEAPLGVLEGWLDDVPGFLSYGRQGLFAHDNLHHALYMAYSAVDCVQEGRFDRAKWNRYREVFATHVVED
jgi:protoporphyrinogen oxidase